MKIKIPISPHLNVSGVTAPLETVFGFSLPILKVRQSQSYIPNYTSARTHIFVPCLRSNNPDLGCVVRVLWLLSS